MTNHEIGAYRRVPFTKKPEGVLRRLRKLDVCELAEYVILLLLARASVLGGMNPFGVAFFAAVFPKQKKVYGILFVCAGILLGGFGILSLKYLGSVAILTTFSLLLGTELNRRPWLYGLIASLSVAVNSLIYVFFDGLLLYDIFRLIAESAAVFLCFLAFHRAAELLRLIRTRTVFDNEDTLSLVLLASSVILSIASIPHCTAIAHTLSALMILILALTNGVAVSAMAGTLLGLVVSTADVLPAQAVGVYAVCSLVAGLLRRYGKWGVSLGFLLTNAAVMLYFNSSNATFIPYYSILAAALILFVLPDPLLSVFGVVARTPGLRRPDDPVERTKEILSGRLDEAAASFAELSSIFRELVTDKMKTEVRDTNVIFEKTAEKVCKSCSMNRYCWQRNFHATTEMLDKLLPMMQERGYAADIDLPERFRKDCLRLEDFLSALNKHYETYRINRMWSGKVLESRALVADQFRNIAAILGSVRSRLSADISQDMLLENRIAAALDRKGVTAEEICVTGADGYEVTMRIESCGGNRLCSTTVAAAVSDVLGVPMLRSARSCDEQTCRLRFREQERFSADIGLAQVTRDQTERSGDNHTFTLLGDGRYVLALSDGMGSGAKANAQSAITVELIKRLLTAGFDKDTSLRLVNSVLLTSTDDETFATVDMCLINLYTGSLEFIKIGAAASYVKSGGAVSRIASASLPAGAVRCPEPDCAAACAKNGDFVILATDGVTDVLERAETNIAEQLLLQFDGTDAQALADTLLLEAVRLSGGKIRDDMTVLCARVREVM